MLSWFRVVMLCQCKVWGSCEVVQRSEEEEEEKEQEEEQEEGEEEQEEE